MKYSKFLIFAITVALFTLTGCTQRLVDFTVISSKNAELGVDRPKAVQTSAKKSYVFGIGWNVKDAMDIALANAGPEYDLLIDGVIRSTSYFFVVDIRVEGLAVNSRQMRAHLGEEQFEKKLAAGNVYDPEKSINE